MQLSPSGAYVEPHFNASAGIRRNRILLSKPYVINADEGPGECRQWKLEENDCHNGDVAETTGRPLAAFSGSSLHHAWHQHPCEALQTLARKTPLQLELAKPLRVLVDHIFS
jgi:hypothetical protein